MIKKILFPTDGSDNSKRAMSYAIDMALKNNAEIIVLTCYELIMVGYDPLTLAYSAEQESSFEESNRVINNVACQEISSKGINVIPFVKKGAAGPGIVNVIESENCDLVVIGSRGMRTVKSFLFGSVSNYVIHHTKVPVLLVH